MSGDLKLEDLSIEDLRSVEAVSACKQCGEPLDDVGRCINERFHYEAALCEKHSRAMQEADDVIVDLYHTAKRISDVQPNCEGLLRSLLRASEYLRSKGIRR